MPDLNRLEEAICATIAASGGEVGRTKLMKLLFLADIKAQEQLGHTITDVGYRFHFYGPYTADIIETAEGLVDEGHLSGCHRQLDDGRDYYSYSVPSRHRNGRGSLTDEERAILTGIAREWRGKPLRDLLDHVYGLEVMQSAVPGQSLRLTA